MTNEQPEPLDIGTTAASEVLAELFVWLAGDGQRLNAAATGARALAALAVLRPGMVDLHLARGVTPGVLRRAARQFDERFGERLRSNSAAVAVARQRSEQARLNAETDKLYAGLAKQNTARRVKDGR